MALIKCPECENEISDKSEKCIHCGYPIAKEKEENITKLFVTQKQKVKSKKINGWSFTVNDSNKVIDDNIAREGEEIILLDDNGNKIIKCNIKIRSYFLNLLVIVVENLDDNIANQVNYLGINEKINTEIKCPICGSTNIQLVSRKWSLLTGILTNKVDRVCMNCKDKF